MNANRLDVKKTYKLYIGGKFPRSESGKVLTAHGPDAAPLDNYSWASRKDLCDAVVAAGASFDCWAKRFNKFAPANPFSGHKGSGFGREGRSRGWRGIAGWVSREQRPPARGDSDA